MSILITGHKGFIGSNFYNYIRKNTDWGVSGWEYDPDNPNDRPQNIHKYAWVIHLGAISSTTERDIDKIMEQNYEFSKWLYRECVANGVNFQYASSASVYGDNLNWSFNEESPLSPQSPYAWSKYLFDRWVSRQKFRNNSIVQGFRYFNVYGDGEEHKGDQASPVTKFTKQATSDRGVVEIFTDSDVYKRDFVWVGDVIRAQIEFIKHVRESGIWNIGTGEPVSFEAIARAVADKHDAIVGYIAMPENLKGQYQEFTCADLTKFNATIPNFKWTNVLDWISDN